MLHNSGALHPNGKGLAETPSISVPCPCQVEQTIVAQAILRYVAKDETVVKGQEIQRLA
jgi:hypothetical protein